jgi:hypothetical protein
LSSLTELIVAAELPDEFVIVAL